MNKDTLVLCQFFIICRVRIFVSHFANCGTNLITCEVILRESINFAKQVFLNFKQIFLLWVYIFMKKMSKNTFNWFIQAKHENKKYTAANLNNDFSQAYFLHTALFIFNIIFTLRNSSRYRQDSLSFFSLWKQSFFCDRVHSVVKLQACNISLQLY